MPKDGIMLRKSIIRSPDWFAVPNEVSASCDNLARYESCKGTGSWSTAIDWYEPEIRLSREEHLRAKGLDPTRKHFLWLRGCVVSE